MIWSKHPVITVAATVTIMLLRNSSWFEFQHSAPEKVLSVAHACVHSQHTTLMLLSTLLSCHSQHVAALCRSGLYHLHQFRPVLRSLTHEAARTLVQAFISSRLDCCNSLLYGVSQSLIQKVQSAQNAAAQLFTGAR